MTKRICFITGSRAEYGLLKPLMDEFKKDTEYSIQLIVTGMHLSPEFGLTYIEIENDGYFINEKIEILLSSDSKIGVSKAMGLAMISFSEVYERLKPDLLFGLGDRFELFAAVSVANVANIPVAHLHGGELTLGAFDEAFRHAITKMSHLHFTATEEYRERVIQLGENPKTVFNVGALGVDNIKKVKLLTKNEIEDILKIKLNKTTLLVTYHPETRSENSNNEFNELLKVFDELENLQLIFTLPNADCGGRKLIEIVKKFIDNNKNRAFAFTSLGQLKYLSLMKYVNGVIGNSSSGLIETPTFKIGTINIGDRQKGRISAKSVVNVKVIKKEIVKAINLILSKEFKQKISKIKNSYGDGNTAPRIKKIIDKTDFNKIIYKEFYDISR
jgi:GDP/UDP-N,N'-diacetylbacillosamine 2-epimerase (hydrolysing)